MGAPKPAEFIKTYAGELFPTKAIRFGSALATVIALGAAAIDSNQRYLWIALGLLVLVLWQIAYAYKAAQFVPSLKIEAEVTRPTGVALTSATGPIGIPGRFVRLLLSNEGGPEARNLHCVLEFTDLEGKNLFDERFPARWAGTEQLSDGSKALPHIGQEHLDMDLPANGRAEPIDVLVAFDEPGPKFGGFVWSNDSMLAGVTTDRFEIPAALFNVTATVKGSDQVSIEGVWRVDIRGDIPSVERIS